MSDKQHEWLLLCLLQFRLNLVPDEHLFMQYSAVKWNRKWRRAETSGSGHESENYSSCNRTQILNSHITSCNTAMSSTHEASTVPWAASARGSSGPLMPVIPIPKRARSFHGPHSTCMHSACVPARTSQLLRTNYSNFDLYLKSRWTYGFLRFLLYFGCSLLTSLLWAALATLLCLEYVCVRIVLRLQYKLSVILLLLGHRRLDFGILNEIFIYSMHITMFLVGGLGWCFMVFVDM